MHSRLSSASPLLFPLLLAVTTSLLLTAAAAANPSHYPPRPPSLLVLRARLADLTRPTLCAARRAHAISTAQAALDASLACARPAFAVAPPNPNLNPNANKPACTRAPRDDVASARAALSVARAARCAAPAAPAQAVERALRAFESAANARASALRLKPAFDTLVLEPWGDAPHVSCLSLHPLNGTAAAQARTAARAARSGALPSGVRVYVPQAGRKVVTFFGGQNLTAWFDIRSSSPVGPWASDEIDAAARNVAAILDVDARLFLTDRWLGAAMGFSQGAGLAAALLLRARVSAVGMLSGFLPDPFKARTEKAQLSRDAPVLVVHGDSDHLVPVDVARLSVRLLRRSGWNVSYEEIRGAPHNLGEKAGESFERAYEWIGRAMVPGRVGGRLVAPDPLVWTLRA